ncbi:Hsp20/alpha crystallin family protein [Brasilonema sp. UFV-L1]|uniref:Hsp20/alpha crystallin family protein n=1 Tax=Brasilonema sp. UFV-L1 TaxID=2234130 RepID=UPI00145E254A|nr:Hsp20/alpha crystallin family protein [Brasilonema sp. UFV-L1]NMG06628.1 Hsp20/alpha crystallin family protein [Brasilonema sp. UFV-L1]
MMIRYWQPFRELENLRRQMDHVFDELTAQSSNASSAVWTPAVELIDAGDNLIFKAQLPGVVVKDIDLQVTRDAISLSGERQQHQYDGSNYLHSEFRYGQFQRVINLPVAVQNDKVQADYHDGILTLTLPKVEEVRNRVVKINLGELSSSTSSQALEASVN